MTGGWYDAGDHGKYVVNGGIATYQLLSSWERNKNQWADGILSIPERGNGVPDVLDEARWNLEFMVKMQVLDGKPFAGMVHPKVHDETLTGPPNLPHLDKKQRELQRPSTAATLNLAAVAARAPGSTRDTTRRSRRSCAPRRRRPTAPTSPAVGITRPGWRSPRTVSTGVRWPPSVRWTWPVTAPPAPTSTTRSTSTAAVRRIPRLHTARPAGRLGSGRPQLQPPGPAGRILAARLRPPLCYVDNIEAWSVNEITINWNSDLAWVAGFAAATKR